MDYEQLLHNTLCDIYNKFLNIEYAIECVHIIMCIYYHYSLHTDYSATYIVDLCHNIKQVYVDTLIIVMVAQKGKIRNYLSFIKQQLYDKAIGEMVVDVKKKSSPSYPTFHLFRLFTNLCIHNTFHKTERCIAMIMPFVEKDDDILERLSECEEKKDFIDVYDTYVVTYALSKHIVTVQ